MSILTLIIKREFLAKVRNKSFIVMTFLSPLLFAAIAGLIAYLSSMKADVKKIAIHDESGMFIQSFKSDDEYKYFDRSSTAMNVLRDSLAGEVFEGVLFIPRESDPKKLEKSIHYISNDSPALMFIGQLEDAVAQKLTKNNFESAHLDTLAIKNAEANVDISLEKASGEESLKGLNEIKIVIGGVFGYLIMMFIIIYGNMVMRSVIEEKTNRIIEIIISSVRPFQLMMGKIIGTSLAGILQFLIWAIIGFVLLFSASAIFGVNIGPTRNVSPEMMAEAQHQLGGMQLILKELWNLPIATILSSFIIYFIGGYFLYSSLYAAIGAAVDSETDSQQFLLPIIMPLILGVYIGFFTVMNNPHGTVATVFSMIPLTSPIVMLMRIPFGVPLWQIALSIVILFGSFLGVVWFASKIYRIGILMYGKKPTYKEIFRWLKY
ncbi:MAG: ABC transporter permease [Flavobacterium sp.]|nr:MAG: ABC transporter permease [Flavobacterium sp.]